MTSIRPLLRISKKKKDDTCPLAIRVTTNRKSRFVYIGESIKEEYWNSEEREVKKSHPKSAKINSKLKRRRKELEDAEEMIERQHGIASVEEIINKIHVPNKKLYFDDLCQEYLELLEKRGSINSYKAEAPRLKVIQEYNKGIPKRFHEISVVYLNEFIAYCKSERNLKQTTINNYLILIKTVFNNAIQAGLIDKKIYPFGKGKVRIRVTSGLKIALDEDEIIRIKELALPINSTIAHTRNVWIFSYYLAGMRVGDVLNIRWGDVKDGRLVYSMRKNDKYGSVKIAKQALDILDTYRPKESYNEDDFIFPELSGCDLNDNVEVNLKITNASSLFNKYLKRIAKLTNINKTLSMHIARHSFANYAVTKNIPVIEVQKLLRHSDIKTTINYLSNFMHKDSDDVIDELFG